MFLNKGNRGMKATTRGILILLLVMANLGWDQFSKDFARKEIGSYETIYLIGEHLVLRQGTKCRCFFKYRRRS